MHILQKRFLYIFAFAISCGEFLRATDSEPTGANVGFITYEAEAGRNQTTGTVVKMTYPAKSGVVTPEMEASGRGYVALTSIGQYLAFPNVAAANAIVIRHCIPDSREGGGMTRTLSLYVNGTKRQTLTLSSFHNWLYGQLGQNGQSNDPSFGNPHSFWDESRFLIQGGIKAGDTIRLQKDAGDTAAFYWIDLIDLENVAPPMPPPPADTFLNVTNYGAFGDGKTDDTKAINACILDAAKQAKIVWMPPGTYRQSERFFLNGVKVQGGGNVVHEYCWNFNRNKLGR